LTHLFEVLKKENGLPIPDDFPLTISEARKEILRLIVEAKEGKIGQVKQ
jgi:hypothetical protein